MDIVAKDKGVNSQTRVWNKERNPIKHRAQQKDSDVGRRGERKFAKGLRGSGIGREYKCVAGRRSAGNIACRHMPLEQREHLRIFKSAINPIITYHCLSGAS